MLKRLKMNTHNETYATFGQRKTRQGKTSTSIIATQGSKCVQHITAA